MKKINYEKLEIIIITYNRYKKLAVTINSLSQSEFKNVKITVLDNCSEDSTNEIVKRCTKSNLNILYIKNAVNIGACANLMRAYEIGKAEYIWVICDDDEYDFSDSLEIFQIIENINPDIIICGTPITKESPKKQLSMKPNVLYCSNDTTGSSMTFILTFLPSAIIKKNSLNSCDFKVGYDLIESLFAQFFWIKDFYNKNWTFVTTKKYFVKRPHIPHGNINFIHINGYLKGVSRISNEVFIKDAIRTYFDGGLLAYSELIIRNIVLQRAQGEDLLKYMMEHIISTPLLPHKLIGFILLPFVFISKGIANSILRLAAAIKI